MIRLLLLSYFFFTTPLLAQDLRVVEDVKPTLNYFEDIVDEAIARGNVAGVTTYIDSIPSPQCLIYPSQPIQIILPFSVKLVTVMPRAVLLPFMQLTMK